MVASTYARYEKRAGIAYVTIDRPEVLNALHPPANAELAAIFEDFKADDACRVAIVTGAGDRAFSAGVDVKGTLADDTEAWRAPFAGITSGFECPKPLIAAVNGVAAGGGFELVLACDIVVAADHARFGLPEPRLGTLAGGGGIHRLTRQIPTKVAMGMLLTGSFVDAAKGHRLGLVNEVVPLADLLDAATRWAEAVLECSPTAIELTKEAWADGLFRTVDEAIERDETIRSPRLRASGDMDEGMRAFAEKRPPRWATGGGR